MGARAHRRSRATPRQSRLAMPRRRNMACAASARGRHSAFIQGLAPRFSTAHETQAISSVAKRRMRRGGRSAQAKMRAARNKPHGEPCQDQHDGRLAQINAPHRSRRHRTSLRPSAAVIGPLSEQNAMNCDVQSRQAPLQRGTDLIFQASGQRKRPLQGKSEFCGRRGRRLRLCLAGTGRLRCVAIRRSCFAADRQHGQRRRLPRAPLCNVGAV